MCVALALYRSVPMKGFLLLLLLGVTQISGSETREYGVPKERAERSESKGLWESDIFFLQKLSSFFGGGSSSKSKDYSPVRRNEKRPVPIPEMIPPQLYYPERMDGTKKNPAVLGHSYLPPANHRGLKKQPPFRGRPGYYSKQKPYYPQSQNIRKKPEKFPVRRFNNGRPNPSHPRPDIVLKTFRVPPPLTNPLNKIYTTRSGGNSIFTAPPKKFTQAPHLPLLNYFPTQHSPVINGFTRTLSSSFSANNKAKPFNREIKKSGYKTNFSPPRPTSIIFPPKNTFLHDNSIQQQTSSSEKRPFHLKQFLPSQKYNFNSIDRPAPTNKVRRKVQHHPRPAPNPQRLQLGPHKFNHFEYNGGDDFKPSPKEGSMKSDAFQPIFRASQSLDVELPSSFMKPIHVASARALTMSSTAPPPEMLNFFEGASAVPL